MPKEPTKNILTKESIAQDLLQKNKQSLQNMVKAIVIWLLFVAIVFLLVWLLVMKNSRLVGRILYYVALALALFPCCLILTGIPASLSEQKRWKNGDFFVVTDRVVAKEIKSVMRHGNVYEKKTLRFSLYGDIFADATAYSLASEGDLFYFVLDRLDAPSPQKYYPAKLYEYKE
jgi:hypothetical protein